MKENSIFLKVLLILAIFTGLLAITIVGYAQTATWTGTEDGNWQNSANWDIGIVPNTTNDVVIPDTYTNKLVVNNINGAKSLNIQSGAELEVILSGSLTIISNFDVYGTLKMTNGSVTVFGDGHLYENGTLIIIVGALTASSCICDTLSTIIYNQFNPEIYAWDHGDVVIQGSGTAFIDGTYANPTKCDRLTLNVPLEIGADKAMIVEGQITNNTGSEGIIIKSNETSTGGFMHSVGDIEGTVAIQGSSSKNVQWHYISSPIQSAHISTFNGETTYQWNPTAEWQGSGDYAPWSLKTEGYLNVGQGYALYANPYGITFYGYLNYANYQFFLGNSETGNADYQGWNLIGNPYTAPVDWDLVVAEAGFSEDIEGAIYFMDDDNQTGSADNYKYYVATTAGNYGIGTADATSIVPVCQGFFVKSNSNNASFLLKKKHRVFEYQPFYKNAKENKILKLEISNETESDELIFRTAKGATEGFDSQLDARKLFPTNEEIPMIFSTNLENDPNMAINSIDNLKKQIRLNIGIKAVEGNYTITSDEINITNLKNIIFVDHYLCKKLKFKEGTKYNFYHNGGIITDRFELILNPLIVPSPAPSPINIEQKNTKTNIESPKANVIVYPNPTSDYVSIDLNFDPNNTFVEIYTTSGMKVKTEALNEIQNTIDISDLATGVYILKINSQNRESIFKNIAVR